MSVSEGSKALRLPRRALFPGAQGTTSTVGDRNRTVRRSAVLSSLDPPGVHPPGRQLSGEREGHASACLEHELLREQTGYGSGGKLPGNAKAFPLRAPCVLRRVRKHLLGIEPDGTFGFLRFGPTPTVPRRVGAGNCGSCRR